MPQRHERQYQHKDVFDPLPYYWSQKLQIDFRAALCPDRSHYPQLLLQMHQKTPCFLWISLGGKYSHKDEALQRQGGNKDLPDGNGAPVDQNWNYEPADSHNPNS